MQSTTHIRLISTRKILDLLIFLLITQESKSSRREKYCERFFHKNLTVNYKIHICAKTPEYHSILTSYCKYKVGKIKLLVTEFNKYIQQM